MRKIYLFLFIAAALTALYIVFVFIPGRAARLYGPPSQNLGISQQIKYSARLLWHDGLLTTPANPSGGAQSFAVGEGESVLSIAQRLAQSGLIRDTNAFLDYVIYAGLDISIQAGEYQLSAAQSIIDVARTMQDATPSDVQFVVLAGWRMEEVAASLPTSGLDSTPEQFLRSARRPLPFAFMAGASTNEGFLFPDSYILPRTTNAEELVAALVRNFAQHLTEDLQDGFDRQGLTTYQAVTLASLIERESIQEEEMPLIASVFLNRLNAGWRLQSDPTVQYAVSTEFDWWPNPLSAFDLDFDSPFNTYLYAGLPPAPIANPSLAALRAVAEPAVSSYFFFRARCDNSGYHNFAVTFDEHIANGC